jgi:hypothetical protein
MAGVQVAGPAKQTLPGRVVLNVMQDNVPSQAVLIAWNMLQAPTLGIGSWIDQLSDPQLEGLSTRRTRLPCLSRVARAGALASQGQDHTTTVVRIRPPNGESGSHQCHLGSDRRHPRVKRIRRLVIPRKCWGPPASETGAVTRQ